MVFGNSKLAHPACFPKPPEGSFSAQSALGEAEGRKRAGVPAATRSSSDPGTKALAPGLQGRGGEGEERLPGHSVTFRGPQRRAPGPSPPRTAPPSAPWPWRGYEISDPFALWGPGAVEGIGGMLAESNSGAMEMGKGLRQRPLGMEVPEGAAVAGCPSGILETVI